MIDMNAFTPVQSLLGGLLIGAAAAMLLMFLGRIAGISGIVGGLMSRNAGTGRVETGHAAAVHAAAVHAGAVHAGAERGLLPTRGWLATHGWRIAFVVGMLAAPVIAALSGWVVVPRVDVGWGGLIGAGLLVGIGTRFAGGCTSGHGVCGLARGSFRSLVATLVFMLAGFATVYVLRHAMGV